MVMRNVVLPLVAAATVGLLLSGIGCGDDDETNGTPTATLTGTPSGTGGGTGGDGATGGTGTGPGAGGGAGGQADVGVGAVMGISGTYLGTDGSVLTALFSYASFGDATDCSDSNDGDCVITVCNLGVGGGGTGGASSGTDRPSAGTLHLSGGERNVDLPPRADGSYAADADLSLLFTGGQTITMAADGADIPAFSEQLTAPALVTVTAPDFTDGTVDVATASPLTVTWTGGTTDEVHLRLSGNDSVTSTSVLCTYTASDGTGTVSAAALGTLSSYGTGAISIATDTSTTIDAGGWQVLLWLNSPAATATSPNGRAAGQASYQ